jgi:hypothetical protein
MSVDDGVDDWSAWFGAQESFSAFVSRAFVVLVFACAIVQYVRVVEWSEEWSGESRF